VLYVLFIIGMIAYMLRISNNWWDPWPVLILALPMVALTYNPDGTQDELCM
jgi:hypothetical protein